MQINNVNMDLNNVTHLVKKAEMIVRELQNGANITSDPLFDPAVWRPVINQLNLFQMATGNTIE